MGLTKVLRRLVVKLVNSSDWFPQIVIELMAMPRSCMMKIPMKERISGPPSAIFARKNSIGLNTLHMVSNSMEILIKLRDSQKSISL